MLSWSNPLLFLETWTWKACGRCSQMVFQHSISVFFSGDKSQPQIYLEKYPSWKIVWKSDRLSRAPAYTRVNDQIWIGSGPTCSWMLRIFKVEINSLSVKFNEGKLVRLWIIIRFVFAREVKIKCADCFRIDRFFLGNGSNFPLIAGN